MKLRPLLVYLTVGAAFLVVSFLVWLTRGTNAKALQAKYRLGGILITTMALISVASCEGPWPGVMCYDPQPMPNTIYPVRANDEIHVGDTLLFYIQSPSFAFYSYALCADSPEKTLLDRGHLQPVSDEVPTYDAEYFLKLGDFSYIGKAVLSVYAEKSSTIKQDSLLFSTSYTVAE